MQDPFFATNKARKRKRSTSTGDAGKKIARRQKDTRGANVKSSSQPAKSRKVVDEELDSDVTDEDIADLDLRADEVPESSGDEDNDETPAEKRLRLAKLYIESVKEGLAEGEYDAAEIDKELISARLRQDVLEHSGKVHLFIADSYDFTLPVSRLRCKGHRLSVTAATASEDLKWLFTAGKEGHINKWDLRAGSKVATFYKKRPDPKGKGKEKAGPLDLEGHSDEILALAVSSDGQYLASGGKDKKICIWDPVKDLWVKNFGGHKDLISSLTFRKGTKQLYSGSFDRTVRLHDLSVMGYVETLFGHQDTIVSIDALRGETTITAGARDRSLRYWKIPEETQLVFRGGAKSAIRKLLEGGAFEGHEDEDATHEKNQKGDDTKKRFVEGSIECVALIDETNFVSGGDTGTGSWDGEIRIWKLDSKLKSFSLVGAVQAPGVVNSLQLLAVPKDGLEGASWTESSQARSKDTTTKITGVDSILLVAGLGQEYRLGRWLTIKEGVTNSTVIMVFRPRTR
ncbi:hypothetical protein ID866_5493 [Astraeus odoratus]|nr:hypothetical protein ID866_5493 [Astraeus odoratus]